jgi:hypothetical protein
VNFRLPDANDAVGNRLLSEYGAVFVARGGVTLPPTIAFRDAAVAADWQSTVTTEQASLGGISVKLQTAALRALMAARADAAKLHLDILPMDSNAAQRTYDKTSALWRNRVGAGLQHWTQAGRITAPEAARVKKLPPEEQTQAILDLESKSLLFGKGFSKSILSSVAAPGASQHLFLLAFDVREYDDARVRSILEADGWFQTVRLDLPHFTYLGTKKELLPKLGLKMVKELNHEFWIPDFQTESDDASAGCPVSQSGTLSTND